MPKIRLSAAVVEQTVCPPDRKRVDLYDEVITGFTCEIRRATGGKTGGKTYYLRYFDAHGRQRQHKIGGVHDITFDQARKVARRLRSEVVLGGDPSAAREKRRAIETYAVLAELHIAHAEANQKASFSAVGIIRNKLVPHFGKMHLDEITQRTVSDFIAAQRAEGLKPATLEKYRVTLSRSFSLGEQHRVPGCESNPVREVRLPKFDNRRQRFLTAEEANRLLEAAGRSSNAQLRPIVHLLMLLGPRLSELLRAEWSDFDLERRSWHIPTSKNGSARHVPLSRAAVNVLEELPRYKDCLLTLPNPVTKARFVSIKHSWQTARKEARLPGLRLHDLRHVAASFLVAAGVDLYAVGKILGHTDYKSTQRYAHLANDTLLAAVEAGAARLGAASAQK